MSQPISKRHLSSQTQSQVTGSCKKTVSTQVDSALSSCSFRSSISQYSSLILNFLNHLPQWGGRVDQEICPEFANSTLMNTCSIDYLLFSLWITSQISQKMNDLDIRNYVHTENIKKMVEAIDRYEWDKAKTIWIVVICKLQPSRRVFDCYGSEYEMFIKHIEKIQEFLAFCSNDKCNINSREESGRFNFFFIKDENGFIKQTLALNVIPIYL